LEHDLFRKPVSTFRDHALGFTMRLAGGGFVASLPRQFTQETRLSDQSKKDAAQAQFAKTKVEDGKKAMAEYEAAAIATRAKTEKLRALRLAREAELAKAAPAKAPAKKKAAKSKKTAAGKLEDWLDDQEKGGHRS
jgi:hypothetical protein